MWQLEYSQEARNYALDSHPYNEAVLMAIESLAQTQTGLPSENCLPSYPENHYLWLVADHWVYFYRSPSPLRMLRVRAIQPQP
jgi:hypothetical protein